MYLVLSHLYAFEWLENKNALNDLVCGVELPCMGVEMAVDACLEWQWMGEGQPNPQDHSHSHIVSKGTNPSSFHPHQECA